MILLPIGRDDSEIRRHAWISYTFIAINVVVFLAIAFVERESNLAGLEKQWTEAFTYLAEHPHLEVPREMTLAIDAGMMSDLEKMRAETRRPHAWTLAKQQEKLNALAKEARASLDAMPSFRYAYSTREDDFYRLITHMFLHADWMHLLGNMLFFFLCGPFVEDVFGRPLFAILYFLGGIASVLTFGAKHAGEETMLVGASGAIAAVMGAYLLRFLRSRIEFIFLPFWWRPWVNFRFFAPAWLVLPLWFVQQLIAMRSETGEGGGTAFSAHVGGFVFGLAMAAIMKYARIEETYVDPAVKAATTWSIDPRFEQAMAARAVGNLDAAKQQLGALLREKPADVDALTLAVQVAQEAGDLKMLDATATRLLSHYVDTKQPDLATQLIRDVTAERDVPPKFTARAAMFAERSGEREWALDLYEQAFDADPNGTNAVGSLVKIGTLLRARGDVGRAKEALQKARAHPACTAEWAPTIDAKIAQL